MHIPISQVYEERDEVEVDLVIGAPPNAALIASAIERCSSIDVTSQSFCRKILCGSLSLKRGTTCT